MLEINKIYNEAFETAMLKIDNNSIDCMCIDPPYKYLDSDLESDYSEIFLIKQAKRVLKKDSLLLTFGRGDSFHELCYLLKKEGFMFKEEIIWIKQKHSSPVTPINRLHESICIFGLGKGKVRDVKVPYLEIKRYRIDRIIADVKRIKSELNNTMSLDAMIEFLENEKAEYNQDAKQSGHGVTVNNSLLKRKNRGISTLENIVNGNKEQSVIYEPIDHYKFEHPTQKPTRLIERLINLISDESDIVLDCFAGSGTTGIAAINTKRNFLCFEKEKKYFNIASKRITKHKSQLTIF